MGDEIYDLHEINKKALLISFNSHKNQTDKSGMPYVFHPFHLAEQMDDDYSVCVALLHDVVEDTDVTIEQLNENGFPEEVVDAIMILTHNDDVPYMTYIKNIRHQNPIAVKVKIADLKHNSDLSRISSPAEKDIQRVKKCKEAIRLLTSD